MKFNKKIFLNILMISLIIASFLTLDIGLRYLTYNDYKFYNYTSFPPIGFSLSWIFLLIGILLFLPQKLKKILYILSLTLSIIITYSQYLHFKIMGRFYGISDVLLVKEGAEYFRYAIEKTNISILLVLITSIIFGIITIFIINKLENTKRDKQDIIFLVGMFTIFIIGFKVCAYINLGEGLDGFDASKNGKIVYQEFSDPTKNLQVTGIYENFYRGIYIYIKNKITDNTKKQKEEINKYINENTKVLEKNNYTGIFENKNVIYVLLESIDNFLITEETMPTLYKLQKEGLNFTNKYTPSFGGGQTINTEFAMNTGLYSPNDSNIFNLNNTYNTSIANVLKAQGYSATSLHFNNGFYYNRQNFHLNLGYTKHYALSDMDINNEEYDYEYDSNLIKSNNVYNLIERDEKFLTFISTYSTHLPFDSTNEKCLYRKYDLAGSNSELTCIKNLARDTDEMLRLLIEKLKENKKLDNTVLVLVTDHYLYGYSYVKEEKKEQNEYLLQHTPFIIWNNQIEHQDIDILVDTADILPTLLNMLNIEYNPNHYIGEDAFSKNRKNYIYFNEDTYYDGNTLYDINNYSKDKNIYNEIKEIIRFNDNLIETNYLKVDTK